MGIGLPKSNFNTGSLDPKYLPLTSAARIPGNNDINFRIGTIWWDSVSGDFYILTKFTSGVPLWRLLIGGGGDITSLELAGAVIINPDGLGRIQVTSPNGTIAWSAAGSGTGLYGDLVAPVPTTYGGTGLISYAAGDILYASAPNTLSKLVKGADAQVLTLAGGIPSWATPTIGDVTAGANIADNAIVRGDGGAKGVQDSGVLISDTNVITGVNQLDVDSANGIDVNPGSDIDADLITVGVTGTPKLSWDESSDGFRFTKGLVVGADGDLTHQINGATVDSDFEIHAEDSQNLGGITIHRHTNTALWGAHIVNLRSNGTHATPLIVADGDVVSRYLAAAYDGTDYNMMAEIRMEVDGTPGANDMPGRIVFLTSPDGSNVPTEAMRISQDQIITLANALSEANGGTAQSTYAAGDILYASAVNTLSKLVKGADTEVLTLAAGLPTWAAATGGGGITWNNVAGTTQTAAVDNGYVCANAALTTVTLPTTAPFGSVVRVTGLGAASWKIDYGTGVLIHFVDTGTDTTITTGSLTCQDRYGSVELLCVVADTTWNVISSGGNITPA